jgi:hypothetical protein
MRICSHLRDTEGYAPDIVNWVSTDLNDCDDLAALAG